MSNIKNMKMLRERMLDAFEKFEDGKIEFQQLFALSKASETIISGLKVEILYSTLRNKQPEIEFFSETSEMPLQIDNVTKLLAK